LRIQFSIFGGAAGDLVDGEENRSTTGILGIELQGGFQFVKAIRDCAEPDFRLS
jgi:hypothetical protein